MPQLIVFDYGGTLDTHGRHWSKVLYEEWRRQLPELEWDAFREAYVMAERQMQTEHDWTFYDTLRAKCMLEASLLPYDIDRATALSVAKRCNEETERCIALSRRVLAALQGRTPLVLVSNFYGNLSTVLENYHMDGFFDHVIESAIVGIRKPDPAIYAKVLEKYPQISPDEILVVGDSEKNDILPARSLGMNTHLVRNFADLIALV